MYHKRGVVLSSSIGSLLDAENEQQLRPRMRACVQSLEGFIRRMQPCYWDHGVCLEGRGEGELPEVLLGGVRAFFWDFTNVEPFPAPQLLRERSSGSSSSSEDDGERAPAGSQAGSPQIRACAADGAAGECAVSAYATQDQLSPLGPATLDASTLNLASAEHGSAPGLGQHGSGHKKRRGLRRSTAQSCESFVSASSMDR